MSKNNRGKGRQHINVLKPSEMDTISLGDAVDGRFRQLCQDYFRIKHEELVPPSYLDKDMLLWRTMMVRHGKQDYRNTNDEKEATRRVAQWTLTVKKELADQPVEILEWKD